MSKTLTAAKDGYLKSINWIVAHPHITFWSGCGVVALAAAGLFV